MKYLIRLIITSIIFSFQPGIAQAGEKSLYDFLWLDPDKTVYVLQNKVHPLKNNWQVNLNYISNLTSNFQDTNGSGLSVSYFFTEEIGLEVSHQIYTNKDNAAFKSIQVVNEQIPFIRNPLSSTSLFLTYAPFYGKVNTFNKIYYFNWSFGIGTGSYIMESNLDSVLNPTEPNKYKKETYNPIQLKTAFTFHINERVHLKLEILNTNIQAGKPQSPSSKDWIQVNDVLWGVGVTF